MLRLKRPITKEEALLVAKEFNLEKEIEYFLKKGSSPEEILYEFDLL